MSLLSMSRTIRRARFRGLFWPLLVAAACSSSLSPGEHEAAARVEDLIDPIIEEARRDMHLPGISIAVLRGDELLFARGYGVSDLDAGTPATADTVYPIASLSKQFAAAAIMKLAEDERLRIDDSVAEYLPELSPESSRGLRIRHLLAQTSGLPEWQDPPEWNVPPEMRDGVAADPVELGREDIVAELMQAKRLYAPGSWWSYCNSNYTLLAEIAERVTGQSYREFLSETFLVPLGLNHTGACTTSFGSAVGYLFEDDTYTPFPLTPSKAAAYAGAGGLCSNVLDLVTWMRALVDGRAVDAASFRRMTTAEPVEAGYTPAYGFGLSLVPLADQPAVWHMGSISGYMSLLAYLPRQDLVIAMVTNSRRRALESVVEDIVRGWIDVPAVPLRDLEIAPEGLARAVGSYDDGMFRLRLFAEEGQLYLHVPALGPPRRLLHQGDGIYCADGPRRIRLWFEPTAGPRPRLVWEWAELRAYGRRVEPH